MDKILWGMGNGSGTVEVTNDGATILRSVGVDNPAAKVIAFSIQDHTLLFEFDILFHSLSTPLYPHRC